MTFSPMGRIFTINLRCDVIFTSMTVIKHPSIPILLVHVHGDPVVTYKQVVGIRFNYMKEMIDTQRFQDRQNLHSLLDICTVLQVDNFCYLQEENIFGNFNNFQLSLAYKITILAIFDSQKFTKLGV